MRRKLHSLIHLIFLTLFLLSANIIFARDITITVIDADLDLPLEGAVIRTREGTEYICDYNGKAVINAPDDRQTIIQAAYPGYEHGVMTIPVTGNSFTISLHLSGFVQGKELVLEASMPGTSESRTGRSIAVTAKEIAQSSEIGIIEDVMSTIKLLPGVNYSGTFDAQPSIRGGHPGDMMASFDGFYINNPYHWGGGYSIFDPRMVQSAQLSHGVFSTRYGHTISGLLEITSKSPSSKETMFELGMNSSATIFNLSFPILGKGGIMFMGRFTYYDPVIELAKLLSNFYEPLEAVHYIERSPYIRSFAITGNYRFTERLELNATAFLGMDGMGAKFDNTNDTDVLKTRRIADFDYVNYQGFITSSLLINPHRNMLLKVTLGAGIEDMIIDGETEFNIFEKHFSDDFKTKYFFLNPNNPYTFYDYTRIYLSDLLFTAQARFDFDWEIKERFLVSAGIQEMYNQYKSTGNLQITPEELFSEFNMDNLKQFNEDLYDIIDFFSNFLPEDHYFWDDLRISMPVKYPANSLNHLLTTAFYILSDYSSPNSRFKTELGLRLEHFYILGNGFSLGSDIILNPRLNIDINILRNKGIFQSFDISLGSGLFSSMNSSVFMAEERYDLEKLMPNRSWTSVVGLKMEFPQSIIFNIEAYFKYVFDRMYIPFELENDNIKPAPQSDGRGIVWGFDLMIQKIQSRFWDGWISYSFNWAKYNDPYESDNWYIPTYHRYHYLNLVINIKPVHNMNIYIRFGLASGVVFSKQTDEGPKSYPVLIANLEEPEKSYFIEKYSWETVRDESNRTTPSLPMDIKFSIFGVNKSGKTRYEVYVAIENVLALLYTATAEGNSSFNRYTGQVDTESTSARYDIPIPIPSFGFKLSY
ncbi:MAG: TonB-dependent receptor plug domain-containing protein [Treponema sp.]|nr:TonB-dependent receptor plug domain-containing protein [Treponema sp.]